jgi:hypothetical protein
MAPSFIIILYQSTHLSQNFILAEYHFTEWWNIILFNHQHIFHIILYRRNITLMEDKNEKYKFEFMEVKKMADNTIDEVAE